jgi:hypothetical protein
MNDLFNQLAIKLDELQKFTEQIDDFIEKQSKYEE